MATEQAQASRRRPQRGERQWRELVVQQAASGLSVLAFCRQEGLSPSSLRRWAARVAGGDVRPTAVPAFVDLGPLGGSGNGGRLELTLDLGGGVVLRLVRG